MKILMTTDAVGGVWTYSLELARALETQGVEFAFATMGRRLTSEQRAEAAALPNACLFESEFKLEWMDDPWDDVALAGEWLLSIEQSVQPDLIHLNGYTHGALPWSRPVLVACHSCVLSWWSAVKNQPAPNETWSVYRKSVARGLCAADQLVAPSNFMRNAVREHYPVGRKPFTVIPNGRNPSSFQNAPKENFVLCAGRLWDEGKNIAALQRVAARSPLPIYAAGDELGERETSTLAAAAAEHNFHVLGQIRSQDLACWMSRAAVYCLPARYEPFGLSVLEAALSGCALILSDIPSLRENWQSAALFVPVDDDGALLHAISRLASDSTVRAQLAAQAHQRALEFSPQRMAESYMRLYRGLTVGWESLSNSPQRSTACAS